MLVNPSWKSLVVGKVYRMRFVFDDQKDYNGQLTGIQFGERVALDHSNISYDFTKDFMERNGVPSRSW